MPINFKINFNAAGSKPLVAAIDALNKGLASVKKISAAQPAVFTAWAKNGTLAAKSIAAISKQAKALASGKWGDAVAKSAWKISDAYASATKTASAFGDSIAKSAWKISDGYAAASGMAAKLSASIQKIRAGGGDAIVKSAWKISDGYNAAAKAASTFGDFLAKSAWKASDGYNAASATVAKLSASIQALQSAGGDFLAKSAWKISDGYNAAAKAIAPVAAALKPVISALQTGSALAGKAFAPMASKLPALSKGLQSVGTNLQQAFKGDFVTRFAWKISDAYSSVSASVAPITKTFQEIARSQNPVQEALKRTVYLLDNSIQQIVTFAKTPRAAVGATAQSLKGFAGQVATVSASLKKMVAGTKLGQLVADGTRLTKTYAGAAKAFLLTTKTGQQVNTALTPVAARLAPIAVGFKNIVKAQNPFAEALKTGVTLIDETIQKVVVATAKTKAYSDASKLMAHRGPIGFLSAGISAFLGQVPAAIAKVDQFAAKGVALAKSFGLASQAFLLSTKTGRQLGGIYNGIAKHAKTVRNLAIAWQLANNPMFRYLKAAGNVAKNADTMAKAISLFRFGSINMAGPMSAFNPNVGGTKAILAYFAQAEVAATRGLKLSTEQFKATILLIRNWRIIGQSILAASQALYANMAGYEVIDASMARIKNAWDYSEKSMNRFRDQLDDVGEEFGFLRADLVAVADQLAVQEQLDPSEVIPSLRAVSAMAVREGILLTDAAQSVLMVSDATGESFLKSADQIATLTELTGANAMDISQSMQLIGREIVGTGKATGTELMALSAMLLRTGADAQQAGGEVSNVLEQVHGRIQQLAATETTSVLGDVIDPDTDVEDLMSVTGNQSDAAKKLAGIFVTANGEVRGLLETLPELKSALSEYTEAEQGILLKSLFGDSGTTVRTLMSFTQDEIAQIVLQTESQFGNVDVAAPFADSFERALARVQASIDAIAIKISEAISPIATQVLNFTNWWLRILDNLPTPIEKIIRVAMGFLPVLALIATIIQPVFRLWMIWKVILPLVLKYFEGLDRGIRAYRILGEEQAKYNNLTQKGLKTQALMEEKVRKLQASRLENLRQMQEAEARLKNAQGRRQGSMREGRTNRTADIDIRAAERDLARLSDANSKIESQIARMQKGYEAVGRAVQGQKDALLQVESVARSGEASILANQRIPKESARLAAYQTKQARIALAVEERKASIRQRQLDIDKQIEAQQKRLAQSRQQPGFEARSALIQNQISALEIQRADLDRSFDRTEARYQRVNGLVDAQKKKVKELSAIAGKVQQELPAGQDRIARQIGTFIGRINNGSKAYLAASDRIRQGYKQIAQGMKTVESTKIAEGATLAQDIARSTQRTMGEIGRELRVEGNKITSVLLSQATKAAEDVAGKASDRIARQESRRIRSSTKIRLQAEADVNRRIEQYEQRRKALDIERERVLKRMAQLQTQPYQEVEKQMRAFEQNNLRGAIGGLNVRAKALQKEGQFLASRYEAELRRAAKLDQIERRRVELQNQQLQLQQKIAAANQRFESARTLPYAQAVKEMSAARADMDKAYAQMGKVGQELFSTKIQQGAIRSLGKVQSVLAATTDRISASMGQMANRVFTQVQLGAPQMSKEIGKTLSFANRGLQVINGTLGTIVKTSARIGLAGIKDAFQKMAPTVGAMLNDVLQMFLLFEAIRGFGDIFDSIYGAQIRATKAIREINKAYMELQKSINGEVQLNLGLDELELQRIREEMHWIPRTLDWLQKGARLTVAERDAAAKDPNASWIQRTLAREPKGGSLMGWIARGTEDLATSELNANAEAFEKVSGDIRNKMIDIRSQFRRGLIDPDSTAGRKAIEFLQKHADLLSALPPGYADSGDKAAVLQQDLLSLANAMSGQADGAVEAASAITRLSDVMAALSIQTARLDKHLHSLRMDAYAQLGNDAEALQERLAGIELQGSQNLLALKKTALEAARKAETDNVEEKASQILQLEQEIAGLEISIAQGVIEEKTRLNQKALKDIQDTSEDRIDSITDSMDQERIAILQNDALTSEQREDALQKLESNLSDVQLEEASKRLAELRKLGELSTKEEEDQRLQAIEETEDRITAMQLEKAKKRAEALNEISDLQSQRKDEFEETKTQIEDDLATQQRELQQELQNNEQEFYDSQAQEKLDFEAEILDRRDKFENEVLNRRAKFDRDSQKDWDKFQKQQADDKAKFELDLQKRIADMRKSEDERIIDQQNERDAALKMAKTPQERADLQKQFAEEDKKRAEELKVEQEVSRLNEARRPQLLAEAERKGLYDTQTATEARRTEEELAAFRDQQAEDRLQKQEELDASRQEFEDGILEDRAQLESDISTDRSQFLSDQQKAELDFLASQRQLQADFQTESQNRWAEFWAEQRKLDRENAEAIAKIREREGILTRVQQLQSQQQGLQAEVQQKRDFLAMAAANPEYNFQTAGIPEEIKALESSIAALSQSIATAQQSADAITAELNRPDPEPPAPVSRDAIPMTAREAELQAQEDAKYAGLQERLAAESSAQETQRQADATHRETQRQADLATAREIADLFTKAGNIIDLGNLPARRDGGPVSAGTTYLVGEAGPELFTPGISGGILPADQTAALMSQFLGNRPNIYAPTPATETLHELKAIRSVLGNLRPGVGSQQISIRNTYQPDGGQVSAMVERSQLALLRSLSSTLGG